MINRDDTYLLHVSFLLILLFNMILSIIRLSSPFVIIFTKKVLFDNTFEMYNIYQENMASIFRLMASCFTARFLWQS